MGVFLPIVTGGGNVEPTPEDYEQLINYTMLYDEGQTEYNWNTLAKGTVDKLATNYAGYESYANSTEVTAALDADGIMLKQVAQQNSTSNGMGCSPLVYTDELDLSAYSKCFANVISYINGYDIYSGDRGVYALLHANQNCGASVLMSTALAETNSTARYLQGTYEELISIDISNISSSRIIFGSILHGGKGNAPQPAMTRYIKGTHIILTKEDDINTLCEKAGLSTSDLATLLADSTAMATIMSNEQAAEFMVKQCTGDFMVACCNSETAMNALVNNIAYDYAFNNEHWYKFMTMCPVSLSAMDSVAVTVPTMTSNTTPSGECFADSTSNSTTYPYYKAFDGDGTTWWESGKSGSTLGSYIGYDLGYLADIYKWSASLSCGNTGNLTVSLQSSDDGTNWVDCKSFTITNYGTNADMDTAYGTYVFAFDTPIRARAMRVITTAYASSSQDNRLKQRLGSFYGKAVAE